MPLAIIRQGERHAVGFVRGQPSCFDLVNARTLDQEFLGTPDNASKHLALEKSSMQQFRTNGLQLTRHCSGCSSISDAIKWHAISETFVARRFMRLIFHVLGHVLL